MERRPGRPPHRGKEDSGNVWRLSPRVSETSSRVKPAAAASASGPGGGERCPFIFSRPIKPIGHRISGAHLTVAQRVPL
uniref:Uncharacterized protein n=1 Tax=Oryza rufipogon TaxID=4529 RepID=A0A0E0PTG2_ORYRU